jgi:uncharacterized membrane protein
MTGYQIVLILIGAVHLYLMYREMVPTAGPALLSGLIDKRLAGQTFTPDQKKFVANIVRNAGVYNGIVAATLFWAAYTQEREVTRVLLTGIMVAGVFGARTLSPLAWCQAGAGLIGIVALYLG